MTVVDERDCQLTPRKEKCVAGGARKKKGGRKERTITAGGCAYESGPDMLVVLVEGADLFDSIKRGEGEGRSAGRAESATARDEDGKGRDGEDVGQ